MNSLAVFAVSALVFAHAGAAVPFAIRPDTQVVSALRVPSKAMCAVVGTHWAGYGAIARPFVIGSARSLVSTNHAMPPLAAVTIHIAARQWMPADASLLLRLMGRWRSATQQIGPMCHRFQMPRVATRPVAAKVVDLETLRNLADENFVGGAMSFDTTAVVGRVAVSSAGVAVAGIGPAGLEVAATNGCGQVLGEDRLAHTGIYERRASKTIYGGKP